jgi:hypothetical protein
MKNISMTENVREALIHVDRNPIFNNTFSELFPFESFSIHPDYDFKIEGARLSNKK